MDNRVYYGQYSLQHWVDLMLKMNITLPEYQRFFVWDENKVKTLIETFKEKQFVPPIIIGVFKDENDATHNYILDGQQRLTSILLAYLGLYPDKAKYKSTIDRLNLTADENDNEEEIEVDTLDNILEWDFRKLVTKGRNKQIILSKLVDGNYKEVNFNINDTFLKETFLGFSYLVPQITDPKQQQKYYSSVFRNINIQGETLLPQESRSSLYFLDKDLAGFFVPEFSKRIVIKVLTSETKADFVRFLALLSQYAKDGNTSKFVGVFNQKMESYYEEYIFSVVGENPSSRFKDFLTIFPDKDFKPKFELLEKAMSDLETPSEFPSIIDMDVYFFGLIYITVFEGKEIAVSKKEELIDELNGEIIKFKENERHKKDPGAQKYLKERINVSIGIYTKYIDEQA